MSHVPGLGQDVDSAVAEVWARRAAELARVPAATDEGEHEALVAVRMGREMYAFGARHVVYVCRAGSLARVPRVPHWVAGVTAIRGRVLSAIDLAAYLGLPAAEARMEPAGQYLVLVETPHMALCLLVDDVVAVIPLALGTLKAAGETMRGLPPEYVLGVAMPPAGGAAPWGEGMLTVLDLATLLADRRIIVNQEVL